jgi:hypothetical protein
VLAVVITRSPSATKFQVVFPETAGEIVSVGGETATAPIVKVPPTVIPLPPIIMLHISYIKFRR